MKLVKDNASAWETYRVAEFPNWGIEKIDRGAWYIFRQWGKERFYIYRNIDPYGKGVGKDKAIAYLKELIAEHRANIIVSA